MKDSRLPKNNNFNIFFQNYTNGLQYVPGPELENVCQNGNTLYFLMLLAFAGSKIPGESVFSNSGTHYLPVGKWEGVSLAGESALDHLLGCPCRGGVFRVCVVQHMTIDKNTRVFSKHVNIYPLQTFLNTDETFWFFR